MLLTPLPEPHKTVARLLSGGDARLHFSQFGEDAILWTYLHQRRNGFYVDIGCHHPFRYSNTALLSIGLGWSGLNVDVDERAISLFRKHRPLDINVCAAVGSMPGETEVTLFDDGAVNSLNPDFADDPRWAHLNPVKKTVQVQTLRDLLDAHLPAGKSIGLMNIDVEGWDMAVLQSNDWTKYRPDYLAVEVSGFNLAEPAGSETYRFLVSKGYRLAGHCFVTSIYEKTLL